MLITDSMVSESVECRVFVSCCVVDFIAMYHLLKIIVELYSSRFNVAIVNFLGIVAQNIS